MDRGGRERLDRVSTTSDHAVPSVRPSVHRVTSAYVARSGVALRHRAAARGVLRRAAGICKDSALVDASTNIVRNVVAAAAAAAASAPAGTPTGRPRAAAAAEKLTGIESQSKVIIQIRGARETDWQEEGGREWGVRWMDGWMGGELRSV